MSMSVHPAAMHGGLPPRPDVDDIDEKLGRSLSLSLEMEDEEYPVLSHGHVMQSLKNEDCTFVKIDCERIPGDSSTTFAAYAIFDGHNGSSAAIFTRENLLNEIMGCMPPNLSREEWLSSLPRAIVAGFVKTDKEWQKLGQMSGTTATLVIVDGWIVTVACVGDSRCVLDAQGIATPLTVDHRLDGNEEEQERIKASGGTVARLKAANGIEIGPLRVWPGGLCLSRSIGDMDLGDYIVAVPDVKQIKLAPGGGRLIIASDGVWDAVSTRRAAKCCRGVQRPESAAKYVVKEALKNRGLRDDTTCLVVDIAPPNSQAFAPAAKRSFMKLLRGRSIPKIDSYSDLTIMEPDLYDDSSTSPTLPNGMTPEASVHAGNSLFMCTICHSSLGLDNGISVHAGSLFAKVLGRSWESPTVCARCRNNNNSNNLNNPDANQ